MEEEYHSENIKVEEPAQIPTAIPLFIKKLWKMVNDIEAENIISWNINGDGFIIHNQLQFITKLLPHYFKHSNMSSFVRQLNFYNFHKVPDVNGIQFAHQCFIRDMPEVLSFIRRKNPVVKTKTVPDEHKEHEIQDLLKDVKDLKGKHHLVDKELEMLKQENLALWTELNSLRVKYTKQSTIINMLIHFLITYIHSHQTAFSKPNIQVATDQRSTNNIKGPPLLEIGYKNPKKPGKLPYTVLQPGTSSSLTYSLKLPENCGPEVKKPRRSNQGLDKMVSMEDQVRFHSLNRLKSPQRSGITYSIKLPGQTEKLSQTEIQRSLLDILKENEQLCEEETDQILTELDAQNENFLDEDEDQQNLMEDQISPEPAGYTVSYPTESAQEVNIEDQPTVHSPHAEPMIIESPQENLVEIGSQRFDYNIPKTVTKEIPIKTSTGSSSYTITYPKLQNYKQDINKNKINVVDHVLIPKNAKNLTPGKFKTVPKFIKIPVKKIQAAYNAKPAATKTNLIKIPAQKATKPKLAKISPAQPNNIANAEGTLLEILKENEKLTNDGLVESPLQNLDLPQTNLESLIDDSNIEHAFENYYANDTGSVNLLRSDTRTTSESVGKPQSQKTMQSKSKNTGKSTSTSYNILENPKEHLSMYVDNTQEEIDILQDILNNLTSTDLSEILNSEPSQICVDDIPVVDEDIDSENVAEEEPATEYNLNTDEPVDNSIDKYFKSNFLDLHN